MFRTALTSSIANNPTLLRYVARILSKSKGFRITESQKAWTLFKANQGITISTSDLHYIKEIIENFDFLFDAVNGSSTFQKSCRVVDFSKPAFHKLTGWENFEIHFPSFPEPVETTLQYINILNLTSGQTIFDLGAYAGVSSLQFSEVVGAAGRVISVEADATNIESIKINFKSFYDETAIIPDLVEKAIWNENTIIKFSSEGNVGSSVAEISGRSRSIREVEAITLSSLANLTDASQVDAIKADIEGAECEVFQDAEFFANFKPKIVFEAILKGERKRRYTSAMRTLEGYGYACKVHKQFGSSQLLVSAKYSG